MAFFRCQSGSMPPTTLLAAVQGPSGPPAYSTTGLWPPNLEPTRPTLPFRPRQLPQSARMQRRDAPSTTCLIRGHHPSPERFSAIRSLWWLTCRRHRGRMAPVWGFRHADPRDCPAVRRCNPAASRPCSLEAGRHAARQTVAPERITT
jgi:hypothetical protein